jgi:succinate dehydrogenase / fumarate reductase membrane anchor subunit
MSAKGTATFIAQRATAVLLLPLVVWFLWRAAGHAGASYEEVRAWLAQPLDAGLFALFIIIAAWHMRIGLGEVIADYTTGGARLALGVLNWLIAAAVALAAAYGAYVLAFAN